MKTTPAPRTLLEICRALVLCLAAAALSGAPCNAQEIPSVAGWRMSAKGETPVAHRLCIDLAAPHRGRGSGKIVGTSAEGGARGCFTQEFFGKRFPIRPGTPYRYSVWYRTGPPLAGSGLVLIDSYTRAGETGRRQLIARKLGPAPEWTEVSGDVTVPGDAVRVRLLLYLHGEGEIRYDDAFLGGTAPGSPNLLDNGGFEPPACHVFDLAPERTSGPVRLLAGFDNATLGPVKQIGPDEFYLYAFPPAGPHSPFLWFHFRVEGCAGRTVTFHVNPTPFGRDNTGGNGTRLPVMSQDGDRWTGVADKSWNEDGTALTFTQHFDRAPAWIASFFPCTTERLARFVAEHRAHPHLAASVLGKTRAGRELRILTVTDPSVADSGKRVMLFTALQHDLETSGALALEGLLRFLLSDDARAAGLRRAFVVHAVPIMNPDGIAAGNLYCPVGNLNRQWGLGTTPETGCVEQFVRALAGRGRRIDLFMDFHGWCTPERTTLFLTFGKEIAPEADEHDALRLADTIRPHLRGVTKTNVRRRRIETVTGITGDLNRLAAGWMKFEAEARLAFSIEIFGEGTCTQQGYLDWGGAFGQGIADFYAGDCGGGGR